MSLFFPVIKGFGASCGLIIAIGAQNIFVLRQGLKREHLLLTALTCSLIDALLILCGAAGFGHFVTHYAFLVEWTKYFALLFLVIYGLMAFKSACGGNRLHMEKEASKTSITKVFLALLAFSLLNPHVYLDTVILLGSITAQQPFDEKWCFVLGAILASFTWFFALTFGAHLLSPLLQKKNAYRIMDGLIAVMLWAIAWSIF